MNTNYTKSNWILLSNTDALESQEKFFNKVQDNTKYEDLNIPSIRNYLDVRNLDNKYHQVILINLMQLDKWTIIFVLLFE